MLNVGIIGYGYWGVNMLRNFQNTANANVAGLCDQRPERLALAQKQYPKLNVFTNPDDLIASPFVDAIVIVTPVFLHYELAKKAILAGKHVLVEKPFTASVKEAEELIELAESKNLTIAVDHTFLFTGSVQKIKKLCDAGELGNLQYFDSTRINLGLFQPDVNVIWDLAPHDISILNYLVNQKPLSVVCTGQSHVKNRLEDIAYLTINYENDFIAHFNCSWISPLKIRRILIGGDKKMCLYDDVEPTDKVKIYETSYSENSEEQKHKMLVDYRTGDIFIPKIEQKEALSELASDFVNAVLNQTKPMSNGKDGLDVVKILEAAQLSINAKGKEIFL